jgi:hypothetical protein
MTDIDVLDETQTQAALTSHRLGKASSQLSQIAEALTRVVDTNGSVWAVGLKETAINSLRTRMYRKDIQISVRRVTRGGDRGHVIMARTIKAGERG